MAMIFLKLFLIRLFFKLNLCVCVCVCVCVYEVRTHVHTDAQQHIYMQEKIDHEEG
jgi:hypothetical protein